MNNTSFLQNVSLPVTLSPDLSLEFRVVKISIYVLIFILAIIGNGLVISVIVHDKKMRSSSHILVLNLAICDLITPTISLPFDLAFEELNYHWPFGATMCKILWPAQTLTTTCSALILTAICIDRYRALVHPFKVRWAGKFFFMVFTIYLLSLAFVVPYAFVLRQEQNGNEYSCSESWPNPQKNYKHAYTMLLCLLQYFIPLMLMITFYSITLKSLFNNNKSLPGMLAEEESGGSIANQEAEKRINAMKEMRKEQHYKVTKMFIFVVIVFAISMFPNQVFWLWVDYGNLSVNQYFSMASIICRIFTYSNSVLNPFIYGLYSRDFRKGYRKAGRRLSYAPRKYYSGTSHANKSTTYGNKIHTKCNNGNKNTEKQNGILLQKTQSEKIVKFGDNLNDKNKVEFLLEDAQIKSERNSETAKQKNDSCSTDIKTKDTFEATEQAGLMEDSDSIKSLQETSC